MAEREQLAALARVDELLAANQIDYWLFGGWAVDFHAGSVTRAHDDLDIAVWAADHERVAALLVADGWTHTPEPGEDGYTTYACGGVRIEVAFLARGEDGRVFTPLGKGRAAWPDCSFGSDVAEVLGVRARVMALNALRDEKVQLRDDPVVAAKDRVDSATLSRVR